mmetsp:Transcript_6570/g.24775  ORF Transcript_6570/g.24775 Transcript_6570/m.24775 type:complete len:227 (+) Transcript_6570:265-945(+)
MKRSASLGSFGSFPDAVVSVPAVPSAAPVRSSQRNAFPVCLPVQKTCSGVCATAASAPSSDAWSGMKNRSPPAVSSQNCPTPRVARPGVPTLRNNTTALPHRSTAPPRFAKRGTSLSRDKNFATPLRPPVVAWPTPGSTATKSMDTSSTSGRRPDPAPALPNPPPEKSAPVVSRAASAACFLSAFFALRGRCFPFARGSPIKTMSSRLFRSPPWLFSMHLSKIRFK